MSGNKNPPAEQQRWELRSEGWEKRPVHCENEYESHTVTRPRLPALQSQTLQEVPTQTGSACVCTCLLRWQCLTLGGAVVYRRHGSIVLAWVRILSRSAVTRRHLQKHTHTQHKRVILNPRVGGHMTRVTYTCVFVPAARAAECIRGAAWALDWWLGDGSRYGRSWAVLPMEACNRWAEGSGAPGIVGRGPCGGPVHHPKAAGPDSSDWTGHLNRPVAV